MSEKDLRPPCKFCSRETCFLLELDDLCEKGCVGEVVRDLKKDELCCMIDKIDKIKDAALRLKEIYEQYSSEDKEKL